MKLQRRRSAFVTLLGSSASTTIAAAQALVLLPLYLDVLGPSLYGSWLATGEAFVWMLAFDFGIPNLLIQRTGASLANGDKAAIGRHFATSLVALLALAVLICGAIWVFAPGIAGLFKGGDELAGALRISVLAVGTTLVGYGFVGLSRGLQDTPMIQGFALGGTLLSFGVVAALLLSGLGLNALAIGLVVRGCTTLVGGVLFVALRVDRSITRAMRPSRQAMSDIVKHCPPMFAAGISYALMNNSAITIAALMFRPEVAAVLGVTRKAADLVRGVLDMIGHSAYGGLSHLFAESGKEKSVRVYRELGATYALVAISLLSAYVAVNGSLIEAWVGEHMYGGFALTVALAASAGLGSWSYMQIGVWRSFGRHNEASSLLLGACAARLALMVGLAFVFGVVGLAVASAATAVVVGLWASRRVWAELGAEPSVGLVWVLRCLPIVSAVSLGIWGGLSGWGPVLITGTTVCALSCVWLLCVDPSLSHYREALTRRLQGGTA